MTVEQLLLIIEPLLTAAAFYFIVRLIKNNSAKIAKMEKRTDTLIRVIANQEFFIDGLKKKMEENAIRQRKSGVR